METKTEACVRTFFAGGKKCLKLKQQITRPLVLYTLYAFLRMIDWFHSTSCFFCVCYIAAAAYEYVRTYDYVQQVKLGLQ